MRCGKVSVRLGESQVAVESGVPSARSKTVQLMWARGRAKSAIYSQSNKAEPFRLVAWYLDAVLWQLKSPS